MGDVNQVLEKLNTFSCEPQRKLLLRNMEINKKYEIFSAKRHFKTKSRKTIIKLNLHDSYIYLPARFNELSDYFLSFINETRGYSIQNCGRWKKTFQLIFSNDVNDVNIADYINTLTFEPSYYTPAQE